MSYLCLLKLQLLFRMSSAATAPNQEHSETASETNEENAPHDFVAAAAAVVGPLLPKQQMNNNG